MTQVASGAGIPGYFTLFAIHVANTVKVPGSADVPSAIPLTGIANYRQLIDRLQAEIERSQRTTRPFTLLFLDLDDFKSIYDRYGHLVGNRALCRVVEVLRFSCRAIDSPARFGGDEFVVILPETDEGAAKRLSPRIVDRLVRDMETPAISVSLGVAVYPHAAEIVEALLVAADRGSLPWSAQSGSAVSLAAPLGPRVGVSAPNSQSGSIPS